MGTVTVGAIVLSYQRPRMLRECLATVRANAPDAVVVVDDGSKFDVPAVVWEFFPQARFVLADPLGVAERLVTPRLGSLINRAMGLLTTDLCAPVCDDDLWAPDWLDAVRAHYARHPATPMVRGTWLAFQDGESPTPDCPDAVADPRGMTTGNFAHRRDLPGARWPEHTVSSHDDLFLWNVHAGGTNTFAVPSIGHAGYRRLHEHNALNFTSGHRYTEAARAAFAGGWLEPEVAR